MSLERVTITGADNLTDINRLIELSDKYPFVEWGILVSSSREGAQRFPSCGWIRQFANAVTGKSINISVHMCGAYVRQFLVGDLDWHVIPDGLLDVAQRIQINTHSQIHASSTGMWDSMNKQCHKEFIFQVDSVNDHLAYAARGYGIRCSVLYDKSGGAGILPKQWPGPKIEFKNGYAGGLGPDNVVENIRKIDKVCVLPYWIDMERRVRTPDDSQLDMDAVESVLKSSEEFIIL